jgi:hypothetical protein
MNHKVKEGRLEGTNEGNIRSRKVSRKEGREDNEG